MRALNTPDRPVAAFTGQHFFTGEEGFLSTIFSKNTLPGQSWKRLNFSRKLVNSLPITSSWNSE
jgi:hypothetical protein